MNKIIRVSLLLKYKTLAYLFSTAFCRIFILIFALFQLWHQYDSDNSGSIEADELKVRNNIEISLCFMLKFILWLDFVGESTDNLEFHIMIFGFIKSYILENY